MIERAMADAAVRAGCGVRSIAVRSAAAGIVTIAGFAACMAGCRASSSSNDRCEGDDASVDTWGLARARVVMTDGNPHSVVIDIQLLDNAHGAELYGTAFVLARRPGVVTIDHRISIHLPESEAFPPQRVDGSIVTSVQSYDPSLSRIADARWMVTIPLRTAEARAALREGGTIVIDPNHCEMARASLRGLAFQW